MGKSSHSRLLDRLRADPIPSTVPGSLPVLFFGDIFSARIATVGINPSRQEFLTPKGQELDGPLRRFETLRSLDVQDRASLSDSDAELAIDRMRGYFDPEKPVYSWFNALTRVVDGMGHSFARRTAAHLDLVQEATDPVWSGLHGVDRNQAKDVLRRDLPFLQWQIETFPLRAIICTSARVMREAFAMFDTRLVSEGVEARVKWQVRIAETSRGRVGLAGWNIPLARPTGLDKSGQERLGSILAAELAAHELL